MKIEHLFLAACLALTPVFAGADESQPPPPLPAGQTDAPPPVDLSGITPLPENQVLPQAPPPLPAVPATPTPRSIPTLAPLPTDTSVPQEAAPTPTEAKAAPAESAAPAPGPERRETGKTPAEKPQSALTDYFPCASGIRWTYKYLEAPADVSGGGTRDVECTWAKTMANGTLRADMKSTEGGAAVVEKYSLYDHKVEHTFEGKEALAGDVVFKLPPTGGTAHWKRTGADGTVHDCKAVYGKAQVYQKTYPDCLIVWDKAFKGKDWAHTLISYYAKGVGLVSVEFYLPGMKMVESKSIALVGK